MSRATPEDVERLIQRFGPMDTSDICWGNSTCNVLKIDTILDQKGLPCECWPRIYQAIVANPYESWSGEQYDSHDYVVFEGKVFNEGVTLVEAAYQDFNLDKLLSKLRDDVKEVTAKRLLKVGLRDHSFSLRHPISLLGRKNVSAITRIAQTLSVDPQVILNSARKHLVYLGQERSATISKPKLK